jgi:hypothetical protein
MLLLRLTPKARLSIHPANVFASVRGGWPMIDLDRQGTSYRGFGDFGHLTLDKASVL